MRDMGDAIQYSEAVDIRHSAEVDIYILANGQRIDVAACHENRCMLSQPYSLPPCEGELVIVIDGEERRRPVYMAQGISADSDEVEFEPVSFAEGIRKVA